MNNRALLRLNGGAAVVVILVSYAAPIFATIEMLLPRSVAQISAVEYMPGELIVELSRHVDEDDFWPQLGVNSENVERLDRHISLEELRQRREVQALKVAEERDQFPLPVSQHLVRVDAGREDQVLAQLLADSRVFHAERAVVWHALSSPSSEPLWDGTWAGIFFGQWYAKRAQFPRAWDKTMGRSNSGQKPVIGVIDTGFQIDHPDYQANVDSRSRNFTPNGPIEHGTGVAGEIGSAWNGIGVAGECPEAAMVLMGAGFPDGSQFGGIDSAKVIEATNYFIANVPDGGVINMSIGGMGRSDALLNAIRAANILVLASAGNEGSNHFVYPAALNQETSKVISVASSDFNDNLADGSNYGWADLAAPGNGNLTTAPNSSWGGISATSAAAGCASGAAGLVWYLYGGDALQVRSALLRSVDVLPSLANKVKTGGRLNVGRAAWGEFNPGPELRAVLDKASYRIGEGQPVTLSLLVSNPDARVTWSFGDGTVASGSFTVGHSYHSFGQYTVSASVTDGITEVSAVASVTVTDVVSLKVKIKAGGGKVVVTATSSRQGQSSSPTLTILETGAVLAYDPDLQAYRLKLKTKDLPATLTVRSSLGGEASQAWR